MDARHSGHDSARHRAARARRGIGWAPVALLAIGAMLVGAAGTYALSQGDGPADASAGCGGPSIVVAAAPEIAPVLSEVVADAGCDQISVQAEAPALVSARVAAGKDAPDVWVPDSSAWARRAAVSAPATPQPLVQSLATSPVVLVAAAGRVPASWSAALADDGLVLGDPLTSAPAAVALVAAVAEAEGAGTDPAATIVPLAQARAGDRNDRPDEAGLGTLGGNDARLTVASEQELLASAQGFRARVPAAGTMLLDYPVLLTTGEERRADIDATTRTLVRLLGAGEARDALAQSGFRDPQGAPRGDGVGKVAVLPASAKQVSAVLETWARLVLPSRTLAVVDVSGSMDFDAGGRTRMELTTAATRQGLGLFPDAAAIGLWAFSERLDGETDHRELLPIRRLGAQVPGGTQRDALGAGLAELAALTGGGTGLYDTTLAAYRAVQADYDPAAANSVLLFSDGANDDPGSISLAELLAELHELADPRRPVRIIAIGISADADAAALRRIARSTGGEAYIAEDPADMATVFREALGSRRG